MDEDIVYALLKDRGDMISRKEVAFFVNTTVSTLYDLKPLNKLLVVAGRITD